MNDIEALLVLPRIRVQNANAISSPLTWGFPSPSAFAGFVHSLHRQVAPELGIGLDGVGIVCHRFEPLASRPAGRHNRVFHLTRNPIDKDGGTASIVEEGRTHMTVSLLIGVTGEGLYRGLDPTTIADQVFARAQTMRLAGGSIIEVPGSAPVCRPRLHLWPGTPDECRKLTRHLARSLLPGFALVSREGLLDRHWNLLRERSPEKTLLDALLDLSSIRIEPVTPGSSAPGEPVTVDERVEWQARRHKGWLVPIPAGYSALSELYPPGIVRNARDRATPFRFVEGVYTIGEWISPHRVDDLTRLLWIQNADIPNGVYRWTTPHYASLTEDEWS